MTTDESQNIALVREYLAALESGADFEILARFFTPDAVQIELPNRLNPQGQRSDLASLRQRAGQGKKILSEQRYEILSEVTQGSRVAVEAKWTATIAIPLGSLPAGGSMAAHFAMFFEFRDGRIALRKNYDCFEPW
jgi:ketosteroid isomerase-like protein